MKNCAKSVIGRTAFVDFKNLWKRLLQNLVTLVDKFVPASRCGALGATRPTGFCNCLGF